MILVVGASGLIGSELTRLLRAQGQEVKTTTGKKGQAGYVNLQTGEGLKQAFDGVDRAFFLSPGGIADSYSILSPLIQEAKRRGLQKVVLMTAMGANASDETLFRRAEIELEKSGLSYNIIRPNWFMDNFTTYWIQSIRQGVLELPTKDAKTSFIDTRDIAAVAAKLLTDDSLRNRDFDLTGPESLTHAQIAAQISQVASHAVAYRNGTSEGLKKGLLGAGASEDYANFLVLIMGFLAEGYNARVTTCVKDITGREPRAFAAYAKEHASVF